MRGPNTKRTFGWDLPPGVTDRMIDEAIQREDDIDMADYSDRPLQFLADQDRQILRDLAVMQETLGSILVVLRAQAEHLVGIAIQLRRLEERATDAEERVH